ncbi:MAG: hypothetical protein H7Z13_00320 [Ferruginibacter sp.]|nr:hypothetical protein [Ferruginibacter sp.]
MTYNTRSLFLSAVIASVFISCTNPESSKTVSGDSSENKFNPAGEQKTGSTYDPAKTATDTMYKNQDSVPK